MTTRRQRSEVCPICGSTPELVREERTVTIRNREAKVPEEFWSCSSCEEEYMTPEQMAASQDRAVRSIRSSEGLLQGEDIRALREEHGLTQRQLERILGVGRKTVVRWETGTVFQSRAVDTLLRVLRDHPETVRTLARSRGVEVGQQRYWQRGDTPWTGPKSDWSQYLELIEESTAEFEPVRASSVDGDGPAEPLVAAA